MSATSLNVGHLMLLLQYGNMSKDTTKYNTRLFAEKVMPQGEGPVRRLGGQVVAQADGQGPARRRARPSVRSSPPRSRRRDRTDRPTTVEVNGFPCRVWTKGSGPKLGFLAGLGGLPRWMPFLDKLAEDAHGDRALAAGLSRRRPATPCSTRISTGCWRCASSSTRPGLAGADLVGASVGGSFAAEMAAIFPGHGQASWR